MELRNLRADITSLETASGLTVDDILGIMQDLWGMSATRAAAPRRTTRCVTRMS